MTTTVRITTTAKSRLRRLQVQWHHTRGETPSDPELLERALAFLEDHVQEFLREAAWRPLTPKGIQDLRQRQDDLGAWSVAELDDIVYGDAA